MVETTTAPVQGAIDQPSWTNAITDAETLGALQTKGWDRLDPAAAVEQAVKAHRAAEKMLGAPADHLVRLPTRPDDEAGWRNVWQRLGAPEKAEDYTFDGIELGTPELTDRFKSAIRDTAAELNMPKAMAERMAHSFDKFMSDGKMAINAENSAAIQAEQGKLALDWGQPGSDRFRANMFVADQAAANLGVAPEALSKLKDGLGAAEVAKMFHKIGVAMGEDRYVAGANPTNNGIMSRDQAVARRAELMADKQWTERYLIGGAPEKREMLALNNLIVGSM
jgi:hypothetical protein